MSDRQGRVVLGFGLWALTFFTALSLVPFELLGPTAERLFPQGNLAGAAGTVVSEALLAGLGVAAAVVPLLPALWGAACFRWWSELEAARWSAVLAAVLVCVPAWIHTALVPFGRTAVWAQGWWGEWLGTRLVAATGWLVGTLLLTLAVVAIVVASLGTGPFRGLGGAVRGAVQSGASLAARPWAAWKARAWWRRGRASANPDLWAADAEAGDVSPAAAPASPGRGGERSGR
ncbi:MAG: DNA translocase FtsK 4TM domain-containing protein, partial [Gemmatimonadota bacterium]